MNKLEFVFFMQNIHRAGQQHSTKTLQVAVLYLTISFLQTMFALVFKVLKIYKFIHIQIIHKLFSLMLRDVLLFELSCCAVVELLWI